eukprot:TRINITY_DN973_c0_g1_i10.p2 TRINITY_DN973_c0_g1~~TRINITY_DN973_c0_g1_i10.p2  ORF type:complete len:121 (-),score=20.21 TRINITY_DN973_c0_g1_i10:246-608(-)
MGYQEDEIKKTLHDVGGDAEVAFDVLTGVVDDDYERQNDQDNLSTKANAGNWMPPSNPIGNLAELGDLGPEENDLRIEETDKPIIDEFVNMGFDRAKAEEVYLRNFKDTEAALDELTSTS